MKNVLKLLVAFGMMGSAPAYANDNVSFGYGWALNYDWLDQIVNLTPAPAGNCPTLNIDVYRDGYKIALERSFYASITPAISYWFPRDEVWTAIAVGPMKNNFGVTFSTIKSMNELQAEKAKKLPVTGQELSRWKVKDSAYWESQGGVAFYLGVGKEAVGLSVYAVASGVWANYLEKTGPNTVYVERQKKDVKTIAYGGGVMRLMLTTEQAFEKAKGLTYEFTLKNSEATSAFERFMAGDATKALELSTIANSGVTKIADTSGSRIGRTFGATLATPFIPVIAFKGSSGKDANIEEEITIWDEQIVKNYGVYKKESSSRLVSAHRKKATSFKGGVVKMEVGQGSNTKYTEKFYGNFKHAFQADWGQEGMLRNEINHVYNISGLKSEPEMCVNVPNLKKTLGYNQTLLHVNYSDEYMREIFGYGYSSDRLLKEIEDQAKRIDYNARLAEGCDLYDNNQNNSPVCRATSVYSAFSTIRKSIAQVRKAYGSDNNAFAFGMANFGKAVWSNPSVFKAFFEKGKECGIDLEFEVSGQRLSRFNKSKKYSYTNACPRR